MVQIKPRKKNQLHDLGYKIFLDRYAQKDMTRSTLAVGDTVIVVVNSKTGQREIGTVQSLDLPEVTIELLDGEVVKRDIEHVDKPLETDPGQMMDRVAAGIASVEKTPELQAEWSERFRWLLDDFKFVPAGRILSAAGTDQLLTYYNCMPPEQEILTADGYRPIAEVKIGDLVVTHRNRLRPVLHKFERETQEPIYIITPKKLNYDSLRVTGDHKILIIRDEWVNKHSSRDGLRLAQEPSWVAAKEVKVGDYVAIAYDGEECPPEIIRLSSYLEGYDVIDGQLQKATTRGEHGYVREWGTHYALNDVLELDGDLCYLFGRWLGDGCITHRTGTDIPSGIKIVFNLEEKAEAENVARIIEEKFGIQAALKLSSTKRWYDLWANSMPLGQFFKAFLGAYSYDKRIPSLLMHLPRQLTLELLHGLFSADGYISGNKLGIVLSNRVLAIQVHQLLLRLGYVFSIKENTHRLGKVPAYRVQATSNECGELFSRFFGVEAPPHEVDLKYYIEYDGLKWLRIDEISIDEHTGIVMDIEVAEDHSFISAGVVVSNCYVIPSPRDSRGGIIETLRQMTEIMSRGGGVGINISSLRPRHSYVKGVNGRSSGAVSWGALYSFVTGLIEQGGCFGPHERIMTDKGLIPAQELADRMDAGERFYAHTHKGLRRITARFRNGVKPLYEVTTKRGYKVRITPDHKVAVLMDGKITTMPLKYLQRGDEILLLLGEGVQGEYVPLTPVQYERSVMSTTLNEQVQFPERLTEDLAYLVGYMHGDGYVHIGKKVTWQAPKAVKMATADAYPEIRQHLIGNVQRVFGLEPTIENGDGACKNVSIHSRLVIEWLTANGLLKAKAEPIRVPEAIFRSPSSVQAAFIAGYFDADGCNRGSKSGYGIDSISREMLADVQQLLALNGIVSRIGMTDRSAQGWQNIYRLTVTGSRFKARFAAFVPTAKRSLEANGKREENTYPAEVWNNLGARAKYRQRIYDGVNERIGFAQLERISSRLAADGQTVYAEQIDDLLNTLPDQIASIEPLGNSEVYDFEVDDVHLLSGSGIYTSNSRRGALMLILDDWHPDVFDFISSKRTAGQITNANISVGISDKLMDAVKADADWDLYFPDTSHPDYDEVWDGDIDAWRAAGRPVIKHRTVKAREIWNAIIESAWASAEPGVWFKERANKMSNSHYFSPLISTNPCGEQSLPAFGVCNLGAINLAKFYDEDANDVDWKTLDTAVRYATRFLDNVIDTTPYFFDENFQQQTSERRVGLNNMGLAELLIRLGLRYGSDESITFIDKLYAFIARAAYETSIELAAEKGAFPKFDADKHLQSGFMQSMPEDIRKKVKKHGIRNVTVLTQAPTGCVAPDTLISTSTGMQPIVSMGDPNGQQWQVMTRDVHTDRGLRRTSHFYVNGRQQVKTVTTRRGFSLTATHNHRIRVIDAQGDYVWRRMDELQRGDTIVLKKNTLGEGETVSLTPVEQGNRALSKLPQSMTPAFAELLGLYMGDGYTKRRGGLHIVVCQQDPDLLDHVQARMQEIWGERNITAEPHTGCWVVNLTGYYLPRFFEANGFAKPAGNHGEGAAGAFIPEKVLRAGRATVAAFLRGLFEADGSIHRGTVTLTSTSAQLIRQAQVALLGLGIVATIREMPESGERYGDRPRYELRILNRRETAKFVQEVGFISQRKRAKAAELGAMSDRGDSVNASGLLDEFYASSKGLPNAVHQRMIGLISNGALTQQYVGEMLAEHPRLSNTRLGKLVSMDIYLDEIEAISDGECDTYDLSVPDNHTYIANGFVSHNTTGTMVNTSTGIEPFFSWVYFRKSRLGLHEEQVPLVKEWYEAHPGETKLPDYFVTAMDLSPEEHVRVQAAIQRWVDSSISKTCNVPNNYTVEQTRKLYEYMYELGCKGGTIYRDGSRDEQVLILKNDEAEKKQEAEKPAAKPAAVEQVATPHRIYPRPKKLSGVTVNCTTPYGTAYVTMNSDENGYPFEVFITAPGKAGSDLQADAEGLGRMISLQLRTTAPQNRMQMLKLVIDQLQGIGGARSIGMGPNRVMSLPDAVAGALLENYFPAEKVEQLNMFNSVFGLDAPPPTQESVPASNGTAVQGYLSGADICPSCGVISLIRQDGCRKCTSCGYSEC